MSRVVDFFDGFSSATTPSAVFSSSAKIESFASDAAYVTGKGSAAAGGDIYYSTTTGYIRFYDGVTTQWRNTSLADTREALTLDGTDISNGYVDLAQLAISSSVTVQPNGGPMQRPTSDFTLSTVGGVTRVTFAGDLVSELIATDILYIDYRYLS